jgi:hypothetical protein
MVGDVVSDGDSVDKGAAECGTPCADDRAGSNEITDTVDHGCRLVNPSSPDSTVDGDKVSDGDHMDK